MCVSGQSGGEKVRRGVCVGHIGGVWVGHFFKFALSTPP